MQNKPIISAIIVAGVLIAGAILLKGSNAPVDKGILVDSKTLAPISANDQKLGNPQAKVALVIYEDFQCSYCGAVSGSNSYPSLVESLKQRDPNWTPFLPGVIKDYVKTGEVLLVHRDWAFLGPESIRASEAARCAGDQNKFWEYHTYLYQHQSKENGGGLIDANLKSFAKTLELDTVIFDKCLDENKYAKMVADSKDEGLNAGVTGTPKGFILKDGKISSTIDGAESYETVKLKIEAALR